MKLSYNTEVPKVDYQMAVRAAQKQLDRARKDMERRMPKPKFPMEHPKEEPPDDPDRMFTFSLVPR